MTESEAKEVIKRLIGISPSERIVRAVNMATEALEEIQQYRAARERQRGKKPEFELNLSDYTSRFVCECGKRVIVKHDSGVMDNHDAPNYCSNCGQRFDWSDTD